jgi:cbb3-type cytochrome oxidase subunit 3
MTQVFRSSQILFSALLGGQIVFAAVVIALKGIPSRLGSLSTEDSWLLLGILTTFSTIAVAFWINEQRKKEAAAHGDMAEKLEHYRNLIIIRCAMVEGGNLMALILALLSGQGFFFMLFLAGLLAFVYFRPSKAEFLRDFNLTPEEERRFNEL